MIQQTPQAQAEPRPSTALTSLSDCATRATGASTPGDAGPRGDPAHGRDQSPVLVWPPTLPRPGPRRNGRPFRIKRTAAPQGDPGAAVKARWALVNPGLTTGPMDAIAPKQTRMMNAS